MHITTPTTQPATTPATLEEESSVSVCAACTLVLEEISGVDITDVIVLGMSE